MALLKRKGGVDDFPLCSPATKIRRLDAELPSITEEEEPLPLPNQERALVLFKPPLLHSPSSFSLTVDSHLISGIRNNQYLWSKECDTVTELHSREKDNNNNNNNNELALVPWVPSSSYQFSAAAADSDNTNTELMEADEMGEGEGVGCMMMDIEQDNDANTSTSSIHYPATHAGVTEGFHQHCFLPQFPHNTSTPITWTR